MTARAFALPQPYRLFIRPRRRAGARTFHPFSPSAHNISMIL